MLCDRLRRVACDGESQIVVCDVGAVAAHGVAVEALARLQLTARRSGCAITLRRASPELEQLLELCGLAEVLPPEPSAPG